MNGAFPGWRWQLRAVWLGVACLVAGLVLFLAGWTWWAVIALAAYAAGSETLSVMGAPGHAHG